MRLEEAPCLVARGWSDAQKKAYVIADNKLAENARWDDDLLIAEITALREEDPTIDLVIGFDEREVDKLAEDIAERAAPKLKGLNYGSWCAARASCSSAKFWPPSRSKA